MSVEDRTIEMERWAAVQAWYQEVLAAALVLDSSATFGGDPTGSTPTLSVKGKQIVLTGNSYVAAQQFGLPPTQWLDREIEGYKPPVVVGPDAPPAPSDAWTQVPAGTVITENGKSYEVRDTPFGKMKFLVRATLATPSLATERAAYVEYIKSRLTETADLEAQTELMVLLTWLSKRA